MEQETIARWGETARRVPGLAPILDSRLRLRRTRPMRALYGLRDRSRVRRAAEGGELKLNVGSGGGSLPGWLNLDISPLPQAGVLFMDATRKWPLPDGCASAVNSEHLIEHLSREQAAAYFTEAYRVLRPGGVIRTSTPDLRGLVDAYLDTDPAVLATHREHGYEARNHGDLLNNYFFEWGHRQIYDLETLALVLEGAGFTEAERASFGESRHPALRGVDTHDVGRLASLVIAVDAVKPNA